MQTGDFQFLQINSFTYISKMKKAFVFPGQGAQYPGMCKELYESNPQAKEYFEMANEILGFSITDIMFHGSAEDLKQTNVTQPAIFLDSIIQYRCLQHDTPDMAAGHSLGEFSALVAANALRFEDGLRLVSARANAMQRACEANPSTMAAVLGLEDHIVEQVCQDIEAIVVAANYNCPGQLVISGSNKGIEEACIKLKEAGAKRALPLPVGGAFHSPLMQPAQDELAAAIKQTPFHTPDFPIYQNVIARAVQDADEIMANLNAQLTGPVKWTQSVQAMVVDGATVFVECGPGKVLSGLIKKIHSEAETIQLQ